MADVSHLQNLFSGERSTVLYALLPIEGHRSQSVACLWRGSWVNVNLDQYSGPSILGNVWWGNVLNLEEA